MNRCSADYCEEPASRYCMCRIHPSFLCQDHLAPHCEQPGNHMHLFVNQSLEHQLLRKALDPVQTHDSQATGETSHQPMQSDKPLSLEERDPRESELVCKLGEATEAVQAGDTTKAVELYKECIQLQAQLCLTQRLVCTYDTLAIIFYDAELFEEAVAAYRSCLSLCCSLECQFSRANYNLGVVLHQLKDYTEVLALHQRTAQHSSSLETGLSLYQQGRTHYYLKNHEEAIRAYTASVDLLKDFLYPRHLADVLYSLGRAFVGAKLYERANQLLARSIKLYSSYSNECIPERLMSAVEKAAESQLSLTTNKALCRGWNSLLNKQRPSLSFFRRHFEKSASTQKALSVYHATASYICSAEEPLMHHSHQIGSLLFRNGQASKAATVFKRLADKWHQPKSLEALERCLITLKLYGKATKIVKETVAYYQQLDCKQEQTEAVTRLIDLLVKEDRHALAVSEASSILTEQLDSKLCLLDLLSSLSTAWTKMGKYRQAIKVYERFVDICRELGLLQPLLWSLQRLGEVLAQTGSYLKAIEVYSECLRCCKKLNTKEKVPQILENLAMMSTRRGKLNIAVRAYNQLTQLHRQQEDLPKLIQTLERLGAIYSLKKDDYGIVQVYEELATVYRQSNKQNNLLPALKKLMNSFERLGRRNEEFRIFRDYCNCLKALERDNDLVYHLSEFGAELKKTGWYTEAVAVYLELLELRKQGHAIPLVFMHLGESYSGSGQYTEALDAFSKCFDYELFNFYERRPVYVLMGLIFQELGKLDEAIKSYEHVSKRYAWRFYLDDYLQFLLTYAMALDQRGDFESASQRLTERRKVIESLKRSSLRHR